MEGWERGGIEGEGLDGYLGIRGGGIGEGGCEGFTCTGITELYVTLSRIFFPNWDFSRGFLYLY